MTTYHVHVTREGKWWMIAIPELKGLTQARRLSEVDTMAREWIAVTLDCEIDEVSIILSTTVVDGIDVKQMFAEIEAGRDEAARMEAEVRAKSEAFAKQLADADIPVRDIGTIMGVSFQRAHQLVTANDDSKH